MVDWQLFATVTAPLLALFVGVWLNRRIEKRPVLLTHWGHVSQFRLQSPDGTSNFVNTHSVVIVNQGKRSATNVRLSHSTLPDFNIWPAVPHRLEQVPDSGSDIVIPTMVPGEQIMISYLYFPPVTYEQVNSNVKHDEGFATHIPVLLQRQYPRWLYNSAAIIIVIGLSALAYVLFEVISWLVGRVLPDFTGF